MHSINGVEILLVEDNILNQRIVNLLLQKLGARCTTASNGQEAIDLMEINHYNVILMDLNMPVMDGYETTRHIRTKMKDNIPIIALTADNIIGDEKSYLKEGINAVISKPIEFEYFTELVMKLISENK